MGTGSGCIALSLAAERPDAVVHAIDISAEALGVARDNARRLGLCDRVVFHEGDLLAPLASAPGETGWLDLVVSNPPYVSPEEWAELEPEVRDYDPRDALVAGADGLAAYEILMPVSAALLCDGGVLVLELGHGQADAVTRMARAAGFVQIDILPDLAGIPRVFSARRGALS